MQRHQHINMHLHITDTETASSMAVFVVFCVCYFYVFVFGLFIYLFIFEIVKHKIILTQNPSTLLPADMVTTLFTTIYNVYMYLRLLYSAQAHQRSTEAPLDVQTDFKERTSFTYLLGTFYVIV